MAEEAKKPAETAVAAGAEKVKKKKLRPTNCAQSNKRIRRKDWYYRDGKYFSNKKNFKIYLKQEADKKKKAEGSEAKAANPA